MADKRQHVGLVRRADRQPALLWLSHSADVLISQATSADGDKVELLVKAALDD
jgi:hypothetical protein